MANRYPWFAFFPKDWETDNVAGCSLAAQGLWLRMLCLAYQSERPGYLSLDGKPMRPDFIAKRCGAQLAEYEILVQELWDNGVLGRGTDGTMFSRRMSRDCGTRDKEAERKRAKRASGDCPANVRQMSGVQPDKQSETEFANSSEADAYDRLGEIGMADKQRNDLLLKGVRVADIERVLAGKNGLKNPAGLVYKSLRGRPIA